jgi:hypothetical protein
MVSKLRRLEVEKCAEEIVKEFGISKFPVKPIDLANSRDIIVQSWAPTKKGVSGFLMKQGDAFGISYSKFIENEGFINFTVGHELGHYFIPGHIEQLFASASGIHYSESGFISQIPCETEADIFSATLLMPKGLFREAQRKSPTGFDGVKSLAALCSTSITATAIRFAEFAEDPVAVILSTGESIDFCCMSDAIREFQGLTWLKRGDFLPSSSATKKFNQNLENIEKGREVKAFAALGDWFDGAPMVEVKEDVIGLGHYGKTLTVLFTEEALGNDEEEEDDSFSRWEKRR